MSRKNSASHFTLPRTQPCFPRPLVFFCLGDGISLIQLLLTGESEGTHRSATKFLGIRMRRRQCVAHSGVRAAEQRNSWVCATKATRSPQRRTRRIATKFIDPCLPRDAILSLYWFYWLRTLYVIQ